MRRILVLLLLAAVLPLLVVEAGIFAYWFNARQAEEARANLELSRAERQAFQAYVRDLGHHETSLAAALGSTQPQADDTASRLLKANAEGYPALRKFLLLDTQGRVIASSDSTGVGEDLANQEFFSRARASGGTVVSDLFLQDGAPVFVVSQPVMDEQRHVVGIVVAVVAAERLQEAGLSTPEEAGNLSIFDSKGHEVFAYPGPPLTWQQRMNPETGDAIKRALAGKEANGLARLTGEGEDRLVARVPVPETGWVVGTGEPARLVTRPIIHWLEVAGGLNLAVMAISLGAALVIGLRITSGVERLRKYAISLGHGDWERTPETGNIDEFARLAEALNQMAAERQKAELRLRQAEDRLRLATDAGEIGLWQWNPAIGDLFATEKCRELFGLPPAATSTYETFLGAIHADDRARVDQTIRQTIADRSEYQIEHRVVWPDGGIHWIHAKGQISIAADGTAGLAGMVRDITEQKRYQEQIERQREFLRRLFDHAPIGIAVIDARSGRYLLANPRFQANTGRPGLSMVGGQAGEFTPAQTGAFIKWILRHVLETRQPYSVREYEASMGPGREHTWWDNDVVPLLDSAGRVESVLALTHEVTEQVLARKRIEELASQMQASRDQLEAIINSMTEGLLVVDPLGNIISANPAALEMHGFRSLQDAPRNLRDYPDQFEFHHADGRPLPREDWPLARAMRGQAVRYMQLHGRRKDTGKTWVGCYNAIPIRNHAGEIVLVILAIHDLTPVKQAEEALRQSEERLRLATEVAGVGAWDWDLVHDQLNWSPQCKAVFGLPPQAEVTYATYLKAVHEEDRRRPEVVRPQEDTNSIEFRIVWPDGGVHWVQSMGRTLRDERGQAIRRIGVAIDITRRKEAETRLKTLNESLEQQVTARTAELERRSLQLRALVSELTETEANERRRLAQVLHDHLQQLLVGAKFAVGAARPQALGKDMRESLDTVDDLLSQSIKASRSLTVELSPPILYQEGLAAVLRWLGQWMRDKHGLAVDVQADEQADPQAEDVRLLLFQSVRELLFNVVKHGRTRQAQVRMGRGGDGHVQIVVSDAGEGFDPRQRFAEKSTEGGFGLFSIRERLELMGGCIEIDSAPGRGTRVTLWAPIHPSKQAEGHSGVVSAPAAKTGPPESGAASDAA